MSNEDWISVNDRLPEIGMRVIGFRPMAQTHGDDVITILKYEGGSYPDLNGISHGFERNHHVSHWKTLPIPPNYKKLNNPQDTSK